MTLEVDQEFAAALGPLLQSQPADSKPKVHDIEGRRARYAAFKPSPAISEDVSIQVLNIKREDGSQLPVYHFKKRSADDAQGPSAAVIYMHGGGFISLSAADDVERLARTVQKTNVQAFSVDYRLAPEHPFPAALDDCWATLTWIHSNAGTFRVDSKRIAVMGDSAGGGLAAALTLKARDDGLTPPIARQILSSPMLDDRTDGEVPGDFKLWDSEDNLTAWTAYLGTAPGGEKVSYLAAPGRITDASGLPKLYLQTSQFDLFVKENLSYVQKFVDAGVEVECHMYPGLPHGFDGLFQTHSVSRQLEDNRVRILRNL